MKAELPYHFCESIHCTDMVVPGLAFCPLHAVAFMGGPLEPLSADASQQTNHNAITVPGDADSEPSL